MNSKPIIQVKNIGKKYSIKHYLGSYVALRDQPEIVFKYSTPKNINVALASTGNKGNPALLKLMVNGKQLRAVPYHKSLLKTLNLY